jgi:UDP-N-acetylmuramoyl-L-alanyl-D-glutamate--2,6-diaminopimelate ligase
MLGEAAAEGADICIVTSDNPRSEDPRRILAAIAEGVAKGGGTPVVVEDRQEAIVEAIGLAREGDAILVAGKGHETYQEIGGRRLRFDDREVVRETLHGAAWSDRVGA